MIAWIWLDLARIASSALQRDLPGTDTAFLHGKVQAAQYFYDYELTKVAPWLVLVATRNPVCAGMQDEWFAS